MFRKLFLPITLPLDFIQKYFKSIILIAILTLIFSNSESKVANLSTIYLYGEIQDSSEILTQIENIESNPNIKGVLLIIDSPGGSVTHSFEIGLAIERLKIPVVTYAIGTMASGSYFAGVYSDYILANIGSVIGSIGVIAQAPNLEKLLDRVGVDFQTVKAGKYKESGTIFREWSSFEREKLQEVVDDIYSVFTTKVAKARELDLNSSKEFAEGKIFISSRAKELGLIDEVGTLKVAKEKLIKLSKITTPIWSEPSEFEKFLQDFKEEAISSLSM